MPCYNNIVIHRAIIALALLSLLGAPVFAGEEACRIRICNQSDGLVQISLDGGASFSTVGRVKHPANARIVGFAAASYVPHGTVAATAIHGIRIKTGQYALGIGKAQQAMLFSIEPREFWSIPRGYGGHQPRSSGIYTDIYAGHSIFRNQSPYVGNVVYVERDHALQALPEDYTPIVGEVFVIIVTRPDKPIASIEFDNKAQGNVTVRYPDESSEVIASVDRPVKGIGRYDGATFTGVGAINTNHGGVLTISTSPTCPPMVVEGGSVETRGGFMIQPRYHVSEQGETSPQVMVIGPKTADQSDGRGHIQSKPTLEGTPPIFFGNINTTRHWGKPDYSFTAQIKIDDGDWEDMPQIIGKVNDAFTPNYLNSYFAAKNRHRNIKQGVTAIRLLFPKYDPTLLACDLLQEVSDYTSRVKDIKKVEAKTTIALAKPNIGSKIVNFYLDGAPVYTASGSSIRWDWDTTKASNGLHEVQIETNDSSLVERRILLVCN